MNRIKFVRNLANRERFWQRSAFISAFVTCLSAEEACEALDVKVRTDPAMRRALLRKIGKDITTVGFCPCHAQLVAGLLAQYMRLSAERRQGCGYCLEYLYEFTPTDQQENIMKFFLASPHASMRRRGYKILHKNWHSRYQLSVELAWSKYQDPPCALLIIEKLPKTFVAQQFDNLLDSLENFGDLAKLFIRVSDSKPELLQRLANIDEITYVYALARLNRVLSKQDALLIFGRNKFDDRVGLLIWSFGQMGLWPVLETLVSRADETEQEKLEALKQKYGI